MPSEISAFPDVQIPGYDSATAAPVHFDKLGADYLKISRARMAAEVYNRNCPAEYRTFDRSNPMVMANDTAVERVLSWKFQKRGLLLAGPTGCAKTRTCWELIYRLCDDGVEVAPYHAMDWLSKLHEGVKYGRDDAKEWVSAVAYRAVVFIDDWGQEANLKSRESWAQAWFFRFLDYRIERGLPLLMTTNLTGHDIAERHDNIKADPLLRRLLEICDVVKFGVKK